MIRPILLLAALTASGFSAEKLNVLFIAVDDLRPELNCYGNKDIHSPNIDALARTGLELDRMYTYKFCSPSRSSLLTGRLPMHVNIYNSNPAQPGAGIPIGMTLISEKLTSVGTMCSARCVCTHMLTHLFSHCLSSLSVGSVPGRV